MKFTTLLIPSLLIIVAAFMRLIPHPANVAPIAAMALFGGVYLNKKYALVVPLLALFVSDIFLGFHNTMPFVYGSFIVTGLIGLWLKKHKNVTQIIGATLFSSLLFYIVTNFGVWLLEPAYTKDLAGFIKCYYLALPFFRNTLIGDLLYVGVFFGSFEYLLRFTHSRYANLHKNRR